MANNETAACCDKTRIGSNTQWHSHHATVQCCNAQVMQPLQEAAMDDTAVCAGHTQAALPMSMPVLALTWTASWGQLCATHGALMYCHLDPFTSTGLL